MHGLQQAPERAQQPEKDQQANQVAVQLASLVEVAGQIGAAPRLQNLTIGVDGANVGGRFTLDEEALKRSLASVLKLFASATARPPG